MAKRFDVRGKLKSTFTFRFTFNPYLLSLAFVVLGTIDCLTTVIGISYLGAVEENPVIAGVAMTNLPLFTVIKLASTLAVGLMVYLAEKSLQAVEDKKSRAYRFISVAIRVICVAGIVFLCVVVLNNFTVVFKAL